MTSIDPDGNSMGDEGVKAFCVPGFQVAAHGVFVASLLNGFVGAGAHPSHLQVPKCFKSCRLRVSG